MLLLHPDRLLYRRAGSLQSSSLTSVEAAVQKLTTLNSKYDAHKKSRVSRAILHLTHLLITDTHKHTHSHCDTLQCGHNAVTRAHAPCGHTHYESESKTPLTRTQLLWLHHLKVEYYGVRTGCFLIWEENKLFASHFKLP